MDDSPALFLCALKMDNNRISIHQYYRQRIRSITLAYWGTKRSKGSCVRALPIFVLHTISIRYSFMVKSAIGFFSTLCSWQDGYPQVHDVDTHLFQSPQSSCQIDGKSFTVKQVYSTLFHSNTVFLIGKCQLVRCLCNVMLTNLL